jgi:hypothetical protein
MDRSAGAWLTRQSLALWAWLAVSTAGCAPGAHPPPPSVGRSSVAAPRWKPISFAILEDYDKGEDLRLIANDFARLRELGVTVWRGSLGWDDYEPEPGRYDFDWLRRFVALADTQGIRLRPYLGYTPTWAARGGKDDQAWNDPPRRIEDWTRFVGAIATALSASRNLLSYEIYNEENVPLWWDGTSAEYAEVLLGAGQTIKRADSDAAVLLGGMVWPDPDWLETACVGGGAHSFDVLPFHAYPETWTPDSVTVENYLGSAYRERFLPQADAACGRKPIWINETGFATTPGKTERDQAEWWARAFATFLAEPRVEHLGIYEIKDQRLGTPVIGDAPNYHLGLIRRDGVKKLAFQTVKLLVQLFGSDSIRVADHELQVRVTRGKAGDLHHHLFIRPDGRQLVFVWDKRSDETLDLDVPGGAKNVVSFEVDGQGKPWPFYERHRVPNVKLEPGRVRIFQVQP